MNESIIESIRYHLEGLRRTPEGAGLYKLIERGLRRYGGADGKIEHAFLQFLYSLLGRYARDDQADPATRVKARIVQQRLALFLPAEPAGAKKKPARVPPAPVQERGRWERIDAWTQRAEAAKAKSAAAPRPATPPKPARAAPRPAVPAPPAPERAEEQLAAGVTEALTSDQELEGMIQSSSGELASLGTTISDFNDLKDLLVRGLDELIKERQILRQKLSKVGEYLKAVETDRKRLRSELKSAQSSGLSDSLTGLPKREIFTRQLEAEVGRVKRYGFALALALIDVDELGGINERFGNAAGDAVLRCYATEILSRFRTYDLVARYGDDEFVVLFPNTQKDGALTALEKARKTVSQTYIAHEGKSIALPSFSSVLTLYSPGEQPAALLRRAADALAQSKETGQDRIVVALPPA